MYLYIEDLEFWVHKPYSTSDLMPKVSRFDAPAGVTVGKSDDLRLVGHEAERLKDFPRPKALRCVAVKWKILTINFCNILSFKDFTQISANFCVTFYRILEYLKNKSLNLSEILFIKLIRE